MRRREWLSILGAAWLTPLHAAATARVVVVGGGYGGAAAARALKRLLPQSEITLVEPQARHVSCPLSNLAVIGLREWSALTQGYAGLERAGVRRVQGAATAIDADARRVHLADGHKLPYDRLVLAPGIGFRSAAIEGYDAATAERLPHAWIAGPQTELLRRQIEAMPDDGVFLITIPPQPIRCPPAPYERVSLIAHFFRQHKPRAKIIMLDAQESFSRQDTFENFWREHYGYGEDGMIRRIAGPQGLVSAVDADKKIVIAGDFDDEYRADVINLIPPQRAADIAHGAGLADETGWCPVDGRTLESTRVPHVHVLGDAVFLDPLPKSAHAAASAAGVAAAAIAAALAQREPARAEFDNLCYFLLAPERGLSLGGHYVVDAQGDLHQGPEPREPADPAAEARRAHAWYADITRRIWGE